MLVWGARARRNLQSFCVGINSPEDIWFWAQGDMSLFSGLGLGATPILDSCNAIYACPVWLSIFYLAIS